jgi:hypothetical protein
VQLSGGAELQQLALAPCGVVSAPHNLEAHVALVGNSGKKSAVCTKEPVGDQLVDPLGAA